MFIALEDEKVKKAESKKSVRKKENKERYILNTNAFTFV